MSLHSAPKVQKLAIRFARFQRMYRSRTYWSKVVQKCFLPEIKTLHMKEDLEENPPSTMMISSRQSSKTPAKYVRVVPQGLMCVMKPFVHACNKSEQIGFYFQHEIFRMLDCKPQKSCRKSQQVYNEGFYLNLHTHLTFSQTIFVII